MGHKHQIWENAQQEFSLRAEEMRKQKEDLITKIREQSNHEIESIQKQHEEHITQLIEQKDCDLEEIRLELAEDYTKRMKLIEEKVEKDRAHNEKQKKIYEEERLQFENEKIRFQQIETTYHNELQQNNTKEGYVSEITQQLENERKQIHQYEITLQQKERQYQNQLQQQEETVRTKLNQEWNEKMDAMVRQKDEECTTLRSSLSEYSIKKEQELRDL